MPRRSRKRKAPSTPASVGSREASSPSSPASSASAASSASSSASSASPSPGTGGTSPPLHQLKIVLRHSRPPIWRRLLIPSSASLFELHWAIQAAFDWENAHRHSFTLTLLKHDAAFYRRLQQLPPDSPERFDLLFAPTTATYSADPDMVGRDAGHSRYRDGSRAQLSSLLPDINSHLLYTYDFGDDWQHDITVEALLPAGAAAHPHYPVVIAGRRRGPPEDSGGVSAYMRRVWHYEKKRGRIKALHSYTDDSYYEDGYSDLEDDPAVFDIHAVNAIINR